MKILTRDSFFRLLEIPAKEETVLSNSQLENLFLDNRKNNAMVGSLCPVRGEKDMDRYMRVLDIVGLDKGMKNAVRGLPNELLPSFAMRNSNDPKSIALLDDVFYLFIKKTVSRDYSGTNPEKNLRLLESSRILRGTFNTNQPEKTLIVVFPKNTRRVSDAFIKTFTEQPMEVIKIIKDGVVTNEYKKTPEEVKVLLEKEI